MRRTQLFLPLRLTQGRTDLLRARRFITGALHLVLDPSDPPIRTTGRFLSYDAPPAPLILSAGFPSTDGASLRTVVSAQRTLRIWAELETGEAGRREVQVVHEVAFDNEQRFDDNGTYQVRRLLLYSLSARRTCP